MYEMLTGIRCPWEERVALVVSCLESHAKRWWKTCWTRHMLIGRLQKSLGRNSGPRCWSTLFRSRPGTSWRSGSAAEAGHQDGGGVPPRVRSFGPIYGLLPAGRSRLRQEVL
ncbi:hypothetical protein KSP40_PGU008827 [Platanthera guangdongensis]|uniref:Uncharacterized protein n=1 Tax=Platanthera guangdongensis TaxID=2320717 RepID=A0ABR2MWW2_9ASPA